MRKPPTASARPPAPSFHPFLNPPRQVLRFGSLSDRSGQHHAESYISLSATFAGFTFNPQYNKQAAIILSLSLSPAYSLGCASGDHPNMIVLYEMECRHSMYYCRSNSSCAWTRKAKKGEENLPASVNRVPLLFESRPLLEPGAKSLKSHDGDRDRSIEDPLHLQLLTACAMAASHLLACSSLLRASRLPRLCLCHKDTHPVLLSLPSSKATTGWQEGEVSMCPSIHPSIPSIHLPPPPFHVVFVCLLVLVF